MSLHAVVALNELDDGLILAPERYDPRRRAPRNSEVTVADVADMVSDTVSPAKKSDSRRFVVLNTGDAQEGLIVAARPTVDMNGLGSAKKVIRAGDVIISRLRPYLRQVALVDPGLSEYMQDDTDLVCSTEFYVLRRRSQDSIAFLVPFLLSDAVQKILQASQEGGHHPRFGQRALEQISVPESILAIRDSLSADFEASIEKARAANVSIRRVVDQCTELVSAN